VIVNYNCKTFIVGATGYLAYYLVTLSLLAGCLTFIHKVRGSSASLFSINGDFVAKELLLSVSDLPTQWPDLLDNVIKPFCLVIMVMFHCSVPL
jgi:hypothetical protein